MAGGVQFDKPDFSDAVPPDGPNQGDMGPEGMGSNRVDENTFESGLPPEARDPKESGWGECIEAFGHPVRGYRTDPVGGTNNPGQGSGGRTMKSAETSGPSEKSAAS